MSIMKLIMIYFLFCIPSFLYIAGSHFAYFQRRFERIAEDKRKNDMHDSIRYAILGAAFWPIITPLVLCLCEFNRYGWSMNYKNSDNKRVNKIVP